MASVAQASPLYADNTFADPMMAQQSFAKRYSLDGSAQAMSDYARLMHEHTKIQLDVATNSARRRSQGSVSSQPAFMKHSGSSLSSVSSTSS